MIFIDLEESKINRKISRDNKRYYLDHIESPDKNCSGPKPPISIDSLEIKSLHLPIQNFQKSLKHHKYFVIKMFSLPDHYVTLDCHPIVKPIKLSHTI